METVQSKISCLVDLSKPCVGIYNLAEMPSLSKICSYNQNVSPLLPSYWLFCVCNRVLLSPRCSKYRVDYTDLTKLERNVNCLIWWMLTKTNRVEEHLMILVQNGLVQLLRFYGLVLSLSLKDWIWWFGSGIHRNLNWTSWYLKMRCGNIAWSTWSNIAWFDQNMPKLAFVQWLCCWRRLGTKDR